MENRNRILKIREINKLIINNEKEKLITYLASNDIDLNNYDETRSPLKIAFNNYFKTKNFDILEILVKNGINIFDDDFIFKILKYNKVEEFEKIFNLRTNEILSYKNKEGLTFESIIKNNFKDKKYIKIQSIIDFKEEYPIEKIILNKDINYLSKNKELYKNIIGVELFFSLKKIISNKINLKEFEDLFNLSMNIYKIEDFDKIDFSNIKNNSTYSYSVSTKRSLKKEMLSAIEIFMESKKENEKMLFFILKYAENFDSFEEKDINKTNEQNIRDFFKFQNILQRIRYMKEMKDSVIKEEVEKLLNKYKKKKVFYPFNTLVLKENLVYSSLSSLYLFKGLNLSKEDLNILISPSDKKNDNFEYINNLKKIALLSLLFDLKIKDSKNLFEIMKKNNFFFCSEDCFFKWKTSDIIMHLMKKNYNNSIDFLDFTDNQLFIDNNDVSSKFLNIYKINVDYKTKAKEKIAKIIELYNDKANTSLLEDFNNNILSKDLLNSILETRDVELFKVYLSFNPKLSNYDRLLEELYKMILRRSINYTFLENIINICMDNNILTIKMFENNDFINNKLPLDISHKSFIEKTYINISNNIENTKRHKKRL